MKYAALVKAIQTASAQFQGRAVMAVNQALVMRNWLVGAWIFEFEQRGRDRAKYGERLLERLADDLLAKGVKGLNVRILDRSRLLYRTYPILASAIPATLSPEFLGLDNSEDPVPRIRDAVAGIYRDHLTRCRWVPFSNSTDTVCRIAHSALTSSTPQSFVEPSRRTHRHRRTMETRIL